MFCGFPQSLEANAGFVSTIKEATAIFSPFIIHNPLSLDPVSLKGLKWA
jgi:hypothetical protein